MYAETFSMPGQELYVIELDPAAVEEAKQLIQEVFATSTEWHHPIKDRCHFC